MLHTRFGALFGLAHPLVNAPMGDRWAGADLAGAVAAAGGLGLIGGQISEVSPDQAEWLRAQIRAVRARTDRPFGVGFILPFLTAYAQTDLIAVALAEGVAALALSFGDPTPSVAPAHAAGAKVLVQVQTVAQARRAVAVGADVIVAQGTDAGGHGGEIGTFSLVPAVVDAVGEEVPVLAAGGIADGRGLAAALLLGAAGAWLGTRFVASPEFGGSDRLKAAVVGAGTDDTVRTVLFDRAWELPFPEGIAGRVIRDALTETWRGREGEIEVRRAEVRQQLDAARAADPAAGGLWAGSAAGLIDGIAPAGEIVRHLSAEAERWLRARPAQLLD